MKHATLHVQVQRRIASIPLMGCALACVAALPGSGQTFEADGSVFELGGEYRLNSFAFGLVFGSP